MITWAPTEISHPLWSFPVNELHFACIYTYFLGWITFNLNMMTLIVTDLDLLLPRDDNSRKFHRAPKLGPGCLLSIVADYYFRQSASSLWRRNIRVCSVR